jgi:hypothetical protein
MQTLVPAFAVRDIILMFNPKAAGERGMRDIKTSLSSLKLAHACEAPTHL